MKNKPRIATLRKKKIFLGKLQISNCSSAKSNQKVSHFFKFMFPFFFIFVTKNFYNEKALLLLKKALLSTKSFH